MQIDTQVSSSALLPSVRRVFETAAVSARRLDEQWDPARGTPVFTIEGRYTTRGWTEWTQGFQYGCMLLTADALDDAELFARGRALTFERMLPHVTHTGVHDHGFNNLSTYGQLLRLISEGRFVDRTDAEAEFRRLCDVIRCSGAVQAARWSPVRDADKAWFGEGAPGYVCSFNGPHSLFIDTMRTIRILDAADRLGHVLMAEGDERVDLLGRSLVHALTSARYLVFDGKSEHTYDVRGRTAHEAIFNQADGGRFRCRSTQQGYSPFSTWTRGLSWAILGYAERLECLEACSDERVREAIGRDRGTLSDRFFEFAEAVCDHFIEDETAADGVTYWDDGAPGLAKLEGWRSRPADPYNPHEPVDSSASAIAAQGLIRLGLWMQRQGRDPSAASRYLQAGLTVCRTLFDEPYLAVDPAHEGILLHVIYHRPNDWDHTPPGRSVPCDESAMWGDYHLLELALLVKRLGEGRGAFNFLSGMPDSRRA